MAKKAEIKLAAKDCKKEFLDDFRLLCRERSSWQVWADFITATACAIANATESDIGIREKREAEFQDCIQRLGGEEPASKMLAAIVHALEENPEQDFLGDLFMQLNLGNHWKGQFFTPYNVCSLMAAINCTDLEQKIQQTGWISVNDCACGAGATLIAMANHMRQNGINYQQSALFVAQDIDRIAGMMCYIQLSLLGCAGYVVIADSLANPVVGHTLRPAVQDGQEIWYTPMIRTQVWQLRQMLLAWTELEQPQQTDLEERSVA